MAQVYSRTRKEDRDRCTNLVSLDPVETERLLGRLLTLTPHLLSRTDTCLRNPSQCCVTSSPCSSMRILFFSIPHVEVVLRCERLIAWVQNMYLDLKLVRSMQALQGVPSAKPARSGKRRRKRKHK